MIFYKNYFGNTESDLVQIFPAEHLIAGEAPNEEHDTLTAFLADKETKNHWIIICDDASVYTVKELRRLI